MTDRWGTGGEPTSGHDGASPGHEHVGWAPAPDPRDRHDPAGPSWSRPDPGDAGEPRDWYDEGGYDPAETGEWYLGHPDQADYDEADYDEVGPATRADLAALVTRRRFLAGLALGGTAAMTGYWALTRGSTGTTTPAAMTSRTTVGAASGTTGLTLPTAGGAAPAAVELDSGLLVPAPVEQRVLVVIELAGGNDGPSTVVPYGTGAYYDARPNLAFAPEQVLAIDDQIGLNPNLARLHPRQFAVVEGVGHVDGSLSHFEMSARWEQGDLSGDNGLRSGYLARLADRLDIGSPTTGLSVAGFTPRFNNATASTLSLDNLDQLWVLTQDDWIYPSYRRAVTGFQGGPLTTTMAGSWQQLVAMGDSLPADMGDRVDEESPMVADGGDLGRQLATAAAMIQADVGVRVIHAHLDGFDTHEGHEWKHEDLMKKLDAALDGFLALLDGAGLSDRVLVATTSEFGRRVKENGGGLDHGAASTMLLFGPVVPGRHGVAPSFTELDDHDNLATTVPFDTYLGTLAQEWLGIPASEVLPTSPDLLGVVPV